MRIKAIALVAFISVFLVCCNNSPGRDDTEPFQSDTTSSEVLSPTIPADKAESISPGDSAETEPEAWEYTIVEGEDIENVLAGEVMKVGKYLSVDMNGDGEKDMISAHITPANLESSLYNCTISINDTSFDLTQVMLMDSVEDFSLRLFHPGDGYLSVAVFCYDALFHNQSYIYYYNDGKVHQTLLPGTPVGRLDFVNALLLETIVYQIQWHKTVRNTHFNKLEDGSFHFFFTSGPSYYTPYPSAEESDFYIIPLEDITGYAYDNLDSEKITIPAGSRIKIISGNMKNWVNTYVEEINANCSLRIGNGFYIMEDGSQVPVYELFSNVFPEY